MSFHYVKAATERLMSLEGESATIMTAFHQEQKSEQTFSNISPSYSSTTSEPGQTTVSQTSSKKGVNKIIMSLLSGRGPNRFTFSTRNLFRHGRNDRQTSYQESRRPTKVALCYMFSEAFIVFKRSRLRIFFRFENVNIRGSF